MSNSRHASPRKRQGLPSRCRPWLVCFLATLGAAPALAATQVDVEGASIALDEGVYELDARLTMELPEDARRAVVAGLSLQLDYEIQIERVRRYVPDAGVADLVQSFELSYHALSQRYLVRNRNTGEQQDFGTLQAALDRLSEVRGLPLIDAALLEPGTKYDLRVRAVLDLRSAPDTLGWLFFWTDDWGATSEWFEWTHRR